jgi:hypothetical protein
MRYAKHNSVCISCFPALYCKVNRTDRVELKLNVFLILGTKQRESSFQAPAALPPQKNNCLKSRLIGRDAKTKISTPVGTRTIVLRPVVSQYLWTVHVTYDLNKQLPNWRMSTWAFIRHLFLMQVAQMLACASLPPVPHTGVWLEMNKWIWEKIATKHASDVQVLQPLFMTTGR